MRLVVFGTEPPRALGEALTAEGFAVERRALPASGGDGAIASLAAALREVESALEAERPQAVLVADTSDEAVMAVVTAVKLGIPTAAVARPRAAGDAPAIAPRVADLEVRATQDAAAVAQAIRALAAPTLSGP